jgi:glucokinase
MMAYLGIDIGGTKTFVAVIDDNGKITQQKRFLTPQDYIEFMHRLSLNVALLTTKEFVATGVAIPGRVDRKKGIGIAFGNLPWKDVPIKADIQKMVSSPVIIENDANLAGLSEAILLKNEYKKVLYLTISTGIGDGVIINGIIDPNLADSEPGQMMLEHEGKTQKWENFASGRAILSRFGKQARYINDSRSWQKIASDIAIGLIDLIAIIQPEVIVIGGSVGVYFNKYKTFLIEELEKFDNPLMPMPALREAAKPDEAVIYGCYELAKGLYGKSFN